MTTEPTINVSVLADESNPVYRQACQEITVEEAGSVVYVRVLGHEVARYSSWASLVNHAESRPAPVVDMLRAAEIYAEMLRKAFVVMTIAEEITTAVRRGSVR